MVRQALHELGTASVRPAQVQDKFRQVVGAASLVEIVNNDLTTVSDDRRRAYLHGGVAYEIKPDGTIDMKNPSYK